MGTKAFDVYGEIALKGAEKVKADLKGVENTGSKAAKGLGESFGGFGKVLAGVGIAVFAKQAIDVMKSSIDAASSLGETQSKVGIVFGASANEVRKFGEDAATALGMSENAALSAAGTYGNLLTATGLSRQAAASMSTTMVQLAADLASFNNASPEETLGALRAGLVGETEPLKRFGVNLNETTIKQKALDMKLITSTTDVLPAAVKAQAAYAIILEQTSDAQGDFARTADGLANQQRILTAQWEDAKATLGQELLPAAVDTTTAFNNLLAVQRLESEAGKKQASVWESIGLGMIPGVTMIRGAMASYKGLNDAAGNNTLLIEKNAEGLLVNASAQEGAASAQASATGIAEAATSATNALSDATAGYTDQLIYAKNNLDINQTAEHRALQDKIAIKRATDDLNNLQVRANETQAKVNALAKDGKKGTTEYKDAVREAGKAADAAKTSSDEYKLAQLNLTAAQNKAKDSAEVVKDASAIAGEAARKAGEKAKAAADKWNALTSAMAKVAAKTGNAVRVPGSQMLFAEGGRPSGPMSGYPVTLHGTEWVIPEKSDSNALSLWRQAGEAIGAFAGMSAPVSPASNTSSMATGGNVYILADSRFTDMNKLKGQVESWNRGGIGSGMLMARMNMGG